MRKLFILSGLLVLIFSCKNSGKNEEKVWSGNPVFEGWYADPEVIVFGDKFWIYPTFSAPYGEQVKFDCFSSPDLVNWTKHENIIDTVLRQDPDVATGAGHHSVLHIPGTDERYAVYHRRPLTETSPHHRVTCIDKMEFNDDGKILSVKITDRGVQAKRIE